MQRLKEEQPKVIGLDIIFAEKSDTTVAASLERLCQKLTQGGLRSAEVMACFQEEQKAADQDRRLADRISRGTPPPSWAFISSRWGPRC